MRLILDMDGVQADLMHTWLLDYNAEYGDTKTHADITGWGVHNYVKPECGQKVYRYLWQEGLYDRVPIIAGLKEALPQLVGLGLDLATATKCDHNPTMIAGKMAWLKRNSQEIPEDNWAFVSNKGMLQGDLLVDDNPEYLNEFLIRNPHAVGLLFDAPWNQDLEAYTTTQEHRFTRVQGWADVVAFMRAYRL